MIVPIFMDSQPAALRAPGRTGSLLLSPYGHRTLLEAICGRVREVAGEPGWVLPTFAPDASYEERLARIGPDRPQLVRPGAFETLVSRYEPSDLLLLIDPRWHPASEFCLKELWNQAYRARAALQVVALERSSDGTKEYIHLDREGHVDRIQRYFDGVTRLRTTGVCCSLVPVSAVRLLHSLRFASLLDLRATLASQGVPLQDVPLESEILHLTEQEGLLALAEQSVAECTSEPPPAGVVARSADVFVGADCEIDPSARLIGPLVIQQGVRIGRGAMIFGPALIGDHARIGAGATVAQCLVLSDAWVENGSTVRHTVLGDVEGGEVGRTVASAASAFRCSANTATVISNSQASGGSQRRRNRAYPTLKRAADAVLAALGLVTLSPLLLAVALIVKLTSRGPILFGHEREGIGGQVFRCWKFRTMLQDAHQRQRQLYKQSAVDGPQFKMRRDPRVTPVGAWLRATNLDELPQLFNVLLGEMSLIGPRPSPFRENQICIPWRKARLSVQPGITGLWQICRHGRSDGDFHQWIYYDMLYVRHLSLALDVKILIATLLTFGGRFSVPLSWVIPTRRLREDSEIAMFESLTGPPHDSDGQRPLTPTKPRAA